MTREEIEAEFAQMIMSLRCPSCGEHFTQYACDWGDAWHEGRLDLLREEGSTERDGPYKVKCERCGERAYIDYFKRLAKAAPPQG